MAKVILANRYHLQNIVGEGSYNIVYKSWDARAKINVAVKELKRRELTEEEAKEAEDLFFREIEILKGLRSPAIPGYYDFIFEGGKYYLVMEWVEGKNLLEIPGFILHPPFPLFPVEFPLAFLPPCQLQTPGLT